MMPTPSVAALHLGAARRAQRTLEIQWLAEQLLASQQRLGLAGATPFGDLTALEQQRYRDYATTAISLFDGEAVDRAAQDAALAVRIRHQDLLPTMPAAQRVVGEAIAVFVSGMSGRKVVSRG